MKIEDCQNLWIFPVFSTMFLKKTKQDQTRKNMKQFVEKHEILFKKVLMGKQFDIIKIGHQGCNASKGENLE